MNKYFKLTNKSFDDLGVKNYQELWQKVGSDYKGLSLDVNTSITKSADNKFHAVFSSAMEDRHGDIVHQNFDLKWFKQNPVFLDSHNYGTIAAILGKISGTRVKDGLLQGDIEFALDNPLGLLAMKLASGGFLNATSIGFIPRAFNDDGSISKSELLEVSAVSVPAQPMALLEKAMEIVESEIKEAEEADDEEMTTDTIATTDSPERTEQPLEATETEEMTTTTIVRQNSRKEALLAVLTQMKQEQEAELAKVLSAVKKVSKIKEKSNHRRQALKALREMLNKKPK